MRKYCIFCKCKLDLSEKKNEKNVCNPCIKKIDKQGFSFFVNLHNERFRSYWNQRKQTICCRVRVTKKQNAPNFKQNILEFLYNQNTQKLNEVITEIEEEDWELIQRKVFGFLPKKREKTTKEKQKQFSLAMEIKEKSSFDIIEILELNTVVATKLKGYHKELFFLKCYMNYLTPARLMRGLYRLENSNPFDYEEFIKFKIDINEMRELTNRFTYRDEIRLIVKEYLTI